MPKVLTNNTSNNLISRLLQYWGIFGSATTSKAAASRLSASGPGSAGNGKHETLIPLSPKGYIEIHQLQKEAAESQKIYPY